jgi:hypothetical protein
VTEYELDGLYRNPEKVKSIAVTASTPTLEPGSFLSCVYRRIFTRGYGGRGMKLTFNLHLAPKTKENGAVCRLSHIPL